jgi:hypothetical protein
VALLTSVPGVTFTSEIIDHLYTAVCTNRIAGIRQALVDISLTPGTDVSRPTITLVPIYLLYAGAPMKTGPHKAVLLVQLTQQAASSGQTGTGEVIVQIVTLAAIRAGIVGTIIHVLLTVQALETRLTNTPVLPDLIYTCCSVQTGGRLAFVNFISAVTSLIAWST